MDRPRDLIDHRWQDVDRIFAAALELPEFERQGFVDAECGDDGALRETITTLLTSTADPVLTGPGTRLLRAALGVPDAQPAAAVAERERIGSYVVARELGRGGMATVYEAERADGEFEQRVAIKLLRGVDSVDVARRFRAERQIMSSLVHPNIARLLDGGTTDDGLPYLVMELVEGEPITRYADRKELDVDGRIDLFLQAAEAVQYAHSRLVVHRDIKPSNVLVAADGRVRLLDFGIAKLLEQEEGEEAAPKTRPATRWMTPEYASPEQVLGAPITTATDVHGLGVLLFELLAGRRPFAAEGRSGFEIERAICEEAAPAPSSVVIEAGPAGAGNALRRRLAGDLDAIVGKALRKAADERYGSAEELRADLVRHREGFPVAAREGLRSYRARKFVSRHRLGVGVAAAFLFVMLLAGAALVRQNTETQRERDRAETEAENAQVVVDFLSDVFRGKDPGQAPSDTITARELLAWGVERVDSEFADRPELQARLLHVMGNAHANMGLFEPGIALLERAAGLRREVFGDTSEQVAETLVDLGGAVAEADGDPSSLPILEEAVAIYRALPDVDERRLATGMSALAAKLRDGLAEAGMERVAAAESAAVVLREALAIRSQHPEDELELAEATLDMAYVLRAADRLAEAEALYEEGIPRFRAHPDHVASELASHLNNFGYLKVVMEDYDGAARTYGEALAVASEELGAGHPNATRIAGNLNGALWRAGRIDEAIEVLRATVAPAREFWPDGHWRLGQTMSRLGTTLLRAGRIEEAEPVLREAVAIYTEQLGPNHEWTEWATCHIAVILILNGEEERGRAYLDGMHAWHSRRRDEGTLDFGTINQLEPFVLTLELVGLEEERRRFAALLPDSAS